MGNLKYQVYGSNNSEDIDVIIFVDKIPNKNNSKNMCDILTKEISSKYDSKKPVDVNLGVLSNGRLVDVLYGSVDEINNALLFTYDYHKQLQKHPQSITFKYERDLNNKIIKSVDNIISLIINTTQIKSSTINMKSSFDKKIDFINQIDFSQPLNLGIGKHKLKCEVYKRIVFQMGQTLALSYGFDLYSKSSISGIFPVISDIINCESKFETQVLSNLEIFKKRYINRISELLYGEVELVQKKTLKNVI